MPVKLKETIFFILNLIFFIFFLIIDHFFIFPFLFFIFFLLIINKLYFLKIYLKSMPPLLILLPLTLLNFRFFNDSFQRSIVLLIPALYYFIYYLIEEISLSFKLQKHKVKIIIFLSVFFISMIVSFRGKIAFSGDEPHYLVVANSIYYDHDLNIANNQTREKTKNFWFSDKPLRFHGYFGKKGMAYIYSFHLPTISVMILPFFAIAETVGKGSLYFILIRTGIAFWSVLLALQFFKFLILSGIKKDYAFYIVILSFLLTPYIFFSIHLYPVIFLSFLMLVAINNLYFEKKNYFIAAISLSFMVWAGVKAILILLFILFIVLLREKLKIFKIKKIISFTPLILSFILFFVYLYNAYGSFSLLSIYNGVLTPEKKKYLIHLIFSFKEIPLYIRLDSLLNYFFDQRDGLLFYFPVFFLFFPALFVFFRKKYIRFWLLFVPFAVHILNYAFNTHRGGYCPPARPISPFVWFMVFMIFLYLKENWEKNQKKLFSLLSSFSIFISFTLIKYPLLMYQTTTHEVKTRASSLYFFLKNSIIDLPKLFPSFLKIYNYKYLPNWIWFFIIITFTFLLLKNRVKIVVYILFGFMLLITFLYLVFPFFSIKKYNKRFEFNKEVFVLKAVGSINKNLKNQLEVFGRGEKFIPIFEKRKKLQIKIISKAKQKIIIKFDIFKIIELDLKNGQSTKINVKRFYKRGVLYFYPLFFRIKILDKQYDREKPTLIISF